jgi:hypothetical protein
MLEISGFGGLTDLQIRHSVRAGVPVVKADGPGLAFI